MNEFIVAYMHMLLIHFSYSLKYITKVGDVDKDDLQILVTVGRSPKKHSMF